MINEAYQDNLAKTAVKIGVNIQPDQFLVINSPIETADFARKVAEAAFEAGAGDVYINYGDEKFNKIRLNNVTEETLKKVPDWYSEQLDNIIERGGAVISISAVDPDLLKDIDSNKISAQTVARANASESFSEALMSNKNRWCIISVPTENWAKKVFPDAKGNQLAVDLLWNAILRSTLSNTPDPIKAWKEKDLKFKKRAAWLNNKQFKELHYKNDLGTDLYIGLPENHVWSGGSEIAQDGVKFFPNLPTEEIFTAPHREKVNGRVVSSYPLVYQGKTIENLVLDFKDGKVVDYSATTNEDIIQSLISRENSNYLGEVALVPFNSPISDMNILFYNTLFDENAACHLALGDSYPTCIQDGNDLSKEELLERGLNQSRDHVDFMIGTEDMTITGINQDGEEEIIFENGNFII